jgi:hypothetical protein
MKNAFRFIPVQSLALGALLALVPACRDSVPSHSGHSGATHHGHGHAHSHDPLHGGKVVVLGEEAFHLELVHDPAAGRLTLYVLDSHMENFVRIKAPAIALKLVADGVSHELKLAAVAQSATGETVGDTSQFSATANWLRNAGIISGRLAAIEIRGQTFTDITFELSGGSPMK